MTLMVAGTDERAIPRGTRSRLAAMLVALGVAAALVASGRQVGAQELGRPVHLDDGWDTGTLRGAGLAPDRLGELLEWIRADSFPSVHSVLLVRGGRLVFEAYFPGYRWAWGKKGFRGPAVEFGPKTLQQLASVTKSVTGLLTGIAIDERCLPNVNAKVLSFFPELPDSVRKGKEGITLAHLLTMTSGLEWNEQDVFYDKLENDMVQLSVVRDPVEYVLAKPVVHVPASHWYYNGGGAIVLGEIIRRCSGDPLDTFAQKHLFDPLGITHVEWTRLDSSDVVDAAGGLSFTPRDLAKIGQTVLDSGTWHGNRVVSERWVQMMTHTWFHLGPSQGYGFLWWTRAYPVGSHTVNAVMADGWGGQRVMVFPTLDLVLVFTGGNYLQQPRLDEIVTRFILPDSAPVRSPAATAGSGR